MTGLPFDGAPTARRPVSAHRDARWYRSAATKTATPVAPLDAPDRSETGWVVVSHLIAAIGLYAVIGALIGNWLGQVSIGMAIGTLVGFGFGIYLVYARLAASDGEPEQNGTK